jgi:hypothetical protein
LGEVSDSGDGRRPGHMSAWEGEDCPDVGHMVPSGGLLIPIRLALVLILMDVGWVSFPLITRQPIRMDILQPIHTGLARGGVLMDLQ